MPVNSGGMGPNMKDNKNNKLILLLYLVGNSKLGLII
jgi:hypothetical protein